MMSVDVCTLVGSEGMAMKDKDLRAIERETQRMAAEEKRVERQIDEAKRQSAVSAKRIEQLQREIIRRRNGK